MKKTHHIEILYLNLNILFFSVCCYFILILPIWHDEAITLLQMTGNYIPNWSDEIVPAGVYKAFFEGNLQFSKIIPMLKDTDVHPPVYYFLLLLWSKFIGNELENLRLFSLFLVIISAAIVVYVSSSYGKYATLVSLTVFLGSPATAWAAVNARDYSLALLFITLTILLSVFAIKKNNSETGDCDRARICIVGSGILCGLSFLTHYFTLLITVPVFLTTILLVARQKPLSAFLSGLFFVSFMGIASFFLLSQLGARPEQFSGFGGLFSEVRALVIIHLSLLSELHVFPFRFQLLFLAFILLGGFLWALLSFARNKETILYAACFVGFGFLFILLFYFTDKSVEKIINQNRYGLFLMPIIAISIGGFVGSVAKKSRVASFSLYALIIFFIGYSWSDGSIHKQPWYNAKVIAPAISMIASAPNERTIVVVGDAYGAGHPATWMRELPVHTQMLVVDEARDLARIEKRLNQYDMVVLSMESAKHLESHLAAFADKLREDGFRQHGLYVFKRTSATGSAM